MKNTDGFGNICSLLIWTLKRRLFLACALIIGNIVLVILLCQRWHTENVPVIPRKQLCMLPRTLPNYDISNIQFLKVSNKLSEFPLVNNEDVPLDKNGRVTLDHEDLNKADIILFWNKYFLWWPFRMDPGSNELQRPRQCWARYPRCVMTTNRKNQQRARVVLVHWPSMEHKDLPQRNGSNVHQLTVLYNIEAAVYNYTSSLPVTIPFNLTASFVTDADLPLAYGQIEQRASMLRDNDERVDVRMKYKNKLVTWFVSHCITPGQRENYVAELVKWIPVDIYGRCNGVECPGGKQSTQCYHMAAREYYFYLSFENSFCTDYVTEKLFNVLQYGMVPVVYGGANYSRLLPPHSYIDATHLHPRDLATKLMAVANDPREYRKYFLWKKTHYVSAWPNVLDQIFCELCRRMEEQREGKHAAQWRTPAEINHWYSKERMCRPPKFKFEKPIFPPDIIYA